MSDEMKSQFTRIMQELYGFTTLWTKDDVPHHPFEYDPDRDAPSIDGAWAVFSAAWNTRTPTALIPPLRERVKATVMSLVENSPEGEIADTLDAGLDAALSRLLPAPPLADDVRAAVVGRLPKTADGVPVVPEDKVWHPDHLARSWEVDYAEYMWMVHINPDDKGNEWLGVDVGVCYSTKEAASVARAAAEQGGGEADTDP